MDAPLAFILMVFAALLGAMIVLAASHPWLPGTNMECSPGYHAVLTANENHHRWYDCKPITP